MVRFNELDGEYTVFKILARPELPIIDMLLVILDLTQSGHSMNVVYELKGVRGCNPQKLENFSNFKAKYLK